MELQEQINLATAGDTIRVPDGEVLTGNFTVHKSLNIIGGPGSKIISPTFDPTIRIPPGTGPVTLQGLEITCSDAMAQMSVLVEYGSGGADQNTLDKVPKGLTIDRCDIYAHPHTDIQRGIAANGVNFKITNSKVREIHGRGYDTQAICSWNGPGPFVLLDCYFEGAGENVMFGGATPSILGLIHSDIEIRRCKFFKPLSWKGVWTIKNNFELKNARRVLIDGCEFTNNWTDAQAGRSIVFTPRPSDSGPAALIEDVVFSNNIIKNVGSGILLLGIDDPPQPQDVRLKRIKILNNLWIVDGPLNGSNGVFATVVKGTEDVTIEHNTALQTGSLVLTDYLPSTRFIFRNNVGRHNTYGIFGSGTGVGNPAITQYFPGSIITGNAIAKEVLGPDSPSEFESRYPAGNYFPEKIADVIGSDYRALAAWKGKATDGKDIGVDIDALNAAQAGTGTLPPLPPPEPPIPTSPTPTALITSPAAGTTVKGAITVNATITGASEVYLLADSDVIVGAKLSAPYNFDLDTTRLSDGNHVLWVRAWSADGKAGDSERVNIIVANSVQPPVEPPAPPVEPPQPKPCSITAPEYINIARNKSGIITVQLNDLSVPTDVKVIGSDGQVTVSPLTWSAGPTSTNKQFSIKVKNKKQTRKITFQSSCGSVDVMVNVI